jgi:DNA-binding response OmpR family regulator
VAKLLVVEDDAMIGMLLADMLCELGYTVAAEAASIDEALQATRKTDFDLAILDADLQGRSVSPVADALVARDIRFVENPRQVEQRHHSEDHPSHKRKRFCAHEPSSQVFNSG